MSPPVAIHNGCGKKGVKGKSACGTRKYKTTSNGRAAVSRGSSCGGVWRVDWDDEAFLHIHPRRERESEIPRGDRSRAETQDSGIAIR